MSSFVIEGGKTLQGSISVGVGKNAPIAILCATLLVRGKVVLKDMSHVDEVERLLELLESIGVTYEWTEPKTLVVDTKGPFHLERIDRQICEKMRISLLLLGALAASEKKYKLYKTGGCRLGKRTVRPHLYALRKLGVDVVSKDKYYEVTNQPLRGADIVMYESSDTATENAIMAAVLAPGVTHISFASANYMVQDLCYFLVAAGAKIQGIGTTTLTIHGVKKLHEVKTYYCIPDPVDAMAWIALSATTKSRLTIKNCALDFLALELEHLTVMGQSFDLHNRRQSKSGHFTLVDITIVPSKLSALPDKLHPRPYPGINMDNVPLFTPILTQAKGQTLVHDWAFENRALYYLELQKLGANVILLDPHRALITGPTRLAGNEVICPPALRPSMAILIAMVAAKGKSVLRNATPIERGYEEIVERLQSVGAHITRLA